MRWWRRLAVAAGAAALVLAVAVERLLLGSLPQTSGTVTVPGLAADALIVRDRWGVPAIRAASEADLYRAVGFAHAQDRLWQMAFNRRLAQGRVAEVVGASGLPFDRFFRTLGLAAAARSSLDAIDPATRRLLDAYADGVNAWLATRPGPLPPEFQLLWTDMEPWRAEHSLLLLKLVALDLAGNWRQELARARLARVLPEERLDELWPAPAADDPLTYRRLAGLDLGRLAASLPPERPAAASNVWVVSGTRTATGSPLLANDPHLGLSLPSTWYAARLEAPGVEVAGAMLPGVPFVVLGQGRSITWGVTSPGFDLQDLFVETPAPADPRAYLAPNGPTPFAMREETIAVRFGAPVRLAVRGTRHGPVISDLWPGSDPASPLALAWTGLDPADRTVEAGFAVARARDAPAFRAAFAGFANPPLNVAFADAHGSIGMISVGAVPVRAGGGGRMPVDGASGAFDWIGALPATAMPAAVDPPEGWLANANNRLVRDGFPAFLTGDWEPPWRARRIGALLRTLPHADGEAMARVQLDLRSGIRDALRTWLLSARPGDPAALRWRRRLLAWDGGTDGQRAEPLVFWAWLAALQPLLWDDELGPAASAFGGERATALRRIGAGAPGWCDDIRTAASESCAGLAGRALEQALAGLRDQLGGDEASWRWDRLHVARIEHRPLGQVWALGRLFSRAVPIGGDSGSIAVAHVDLDDRFASRHAASWRGLYDVAEPRRSRFILPGGQSGHPGSRHYDDMLRAWREGRYLPLLADPTRPSRVLRLRSYTRSHDRSIDQP